MEALPDHCSPLSGSTTSGSMMSGWSTTADQYYGKDDGILYVMGSDGQYHPESDDSCDSHESMTGYDPVPVWDPVKEEYRYATVGRSWDSQKPQSLPSYDEMLTAADRQQGVTAPVIALASLLPPSICSLVAAPTGLKHALSPLREIRDILVSLRAKDLDVREGISAKEAIMSRDLPCAKKEAILSSIRGKERLPDAAVDPQLERIKLLIRSLDPRIRRFKIKLESHMADGKPIVVVYSLVDNIVSPETFHYNYSSLKHGVVRLNAAETRLYKAFMSKDGDSYLALTPRCAPGAWLTEEIAFIEALIEIISERHGCKGMPSPRGEGLRCKRKRTRCRRKPTRCRRKRSSRSRRKRTRRKRTRRKRTMCRRKRVRSSRRHKRSRGETRKKNNKR